MDDDDKTSSLEALEFTGRRAKGVALNLLGVLRGCDLPPLHWQEVVEHLRDLVAEEVERKGLTSE
jgi:hypothetical protein